MATKITRSDLLTSASVHCYTPVGRYQAVMLLAASGERVWTVVGPDGTLFLPACIFLAVDRRPTTNSRNTLEAEACSIAKLLNACAVEDIDIVERVRSGKFLSTPERTRLVALLGWGVLKSTLANCLSAALGFLRFVADVREERFEPGAESDRYARRSDKFFAAFSGALRRPSRGDSPREPLVGEAKEEFVRIIDSQAACERVWDSPYVALRNRAFMAVALLEGHRRDELLNLRVSDIDFETGSYRIERRPDDIADPRRHQPLVKGYSRLLKLAAPALEIIAELVIKRDMLGEGPRVVLPAADVGLRDIGATTRPTRSRHTDGCCPRHRCRRRATLPKGSLHQRARDRVSRAGGFSPTLDGQGHPETNWERSGYELP